MVLRSKQFDDIYFTARDGFWETEHVFLRGNSLPDAWLGKENFCIGETGFGTGLNFLAVADLFMRSTAPYQKLNYVSFELYPLRAEDIEEALRPWAHRFDNYLPWFLELYAASDLHHSDRSCVILPFLAQRIDVQIILGDVNESLPRWRGFADAWFLDGFKPSINPQMWTQTVFENIARCSHSGASFATFTAAGFVRRGLQQAGFEVHKVQGFGSKRHMLIGRKR